MALLLWGCTASETDETAPVLMRIGLDSEQESTIRSAYVFIYNSAGALENRGDLAIDADNKTWTVSEGTKDIFIVANPDADLAARLTSSLTKPQLLNLFTASFSDLITGAVSADISESNNQIDVPLYRRHARIDFQLRKEDGLTANVVLKSVTLAEQEQAGLVFAAETAAYSAYSVKADQTNTMNFTVGNTFTADAQTGFYTYPRPAAPDNTRAMRLEMVVEIDGVGKMLDVYINSGALNGARANDPDLPLAILGNTIYQVNATLTRQSAEVALNIHDWKNAPLTTPIHGATLWVERSKITMTSATATVGYSTDAVVAIDVTTPQPWLEVSYTSSSITLTHVGTSQTAQPDAVISLKAGNISRTITVEWSAPSVL